MLDRQLTALAFPSQSACVVMGDDYGTVTVLKICKTDNHEDDSGNGLMNPYIKNPNEDEGAVWRHLQMSLLQDIISSKQLANATSAST